jgi:hypothetical protein
MDRWSLMQDKMGRSALHVAAQAGSLTCLQLSKSLTSFIEVVLRYCLLLYEYICFSTSGRCGSEYSRGYSSGPDSSPYGRQGRSGRPSGVSDTAGG